MGEEASPAVPNYDSVLNSSTFLTSFEYVRDMHAHQLTAFDSSNGRTYCFLKAISELKNF